MKNPVIQKDIMRYKKNKLAGNLALLSIVFMCLYFMVMYAQVAGDIEAKFTNKENVYTVLNGVSVVLNLVLLLAIFLSSEELKGYNKKFSFVVWVIAAIQIVRIFGYPVSTFSKKIRSGMREVALLDGGTFALLIIFLIASAACLIAAGVIGYIRSAQLEKFRAQVADGTVDLNGALAEEEVAAPVAPQPEVKAVSEVQEEPITAEPKVVNEEAEAPSLSAAETKTDSEGEVE